MHNTMAKWNAGVNNFAETKLWDTTKAEASKIQDNKNASNKHGKVLKCIDFLSYCIEQQFTCS